jgi:hypothetical protein
MGFFSRLAKSKAALITAVVQRKDGKWQYEYVSDTYARDPGYAESMAQAVNTTIDEMARAVSRSEVPQTAEFQLAIYPWPIDRCAHVFEIAGGVGEFTTKDTTGHHARGTGATLDELVHNLDGGEAVDGMLVWWRNAGDGTL